MESESLKMHRPVALVTSTLLKIEPIGFQENMQIDLGYEAAISAVIFQSFRKF